MLSMFAGPVTKLVGDLIDNLFETEEEKANAKAKLIKLEQGGKLKAAEVQLSAIIAEAKSADPWTSRARPSFLYLIYAVIALCFVGGILGIWWPDHVTQAAANIQAMLAAVPDALWTLFGAGYLGYTGARSWDKTKGISPEK